MNTQGIIILGNHYLYEYPVLPCNELPCSTLYEYPVLPCMNTLYYPVMNPLYYPVLPCISFINKLTNMNYVW